MMGGSSSSFPLEHIWTDSITDTEIVAPEGLETTMGNRHWEVAEMTGTHAQLTPE